MRRMIFGIALGLCLLSVTSLAPAQRNPFSPPFPAYRSPSVFPPAFRLRAREVVEGWYLRYLGRDLDPGAAVWIDQLRRGENPSAVLAGILGSDEYYQQSGSTPRRFIDRLYIDVAGRRIDGREMDQMLQRLRFSDRQQVAYELLLRYPNAVLNPMAEGNDVRRPWLP
jgi:hypothetical protein